MDEQQFWTIIDLFDWSKQDHNMDRVTNDNAIMQPAIDKLAEFSIEDIQEFEEILAQKLYALDTVQHADIATDSSDGFLYDRCYAVARGKPFYENVLHDPSQMRPFWLEVPEGFDFDGASLLSLTKESAERKGIIDFWHSTKVSYETGSNKEGWIDDTSPNNLPAQ